MPVTSIFLDSRLKEFFIESKNAPIKVWTKKIILQTNLFVFKPKAFLILHLNDHLYSKPCVFLWVANFRGLIAGFTSLSTFSRAFTVGHICITKNTGAFTQGSIYPCLLLPDTNFHFHVYNRATLLDVVLSYRAHPIKHQTRC